MAVSVNKLPKMPHTAAGAGIFARSEDKDLHIAGGQDVEIFHVLHDGGSASASVQTGFEMVKGGYLAEVLPTVDVVTTPGSATFAFTATTAPSLPIAGQVDFEVKVNASDPTIADLTGLPLSAKVYFLVVFGFKNPETLQ